MPDNIAAIATSATSLIVGKLHIATCKENIVNCMLRYNMRVNYVFRPRGWLKTTIIVH
ncbi:hypothetical protein HanRHA438_Chr17g0807231 [Helianthus annuus]|nr:hypothetical protein HanRHA438_Chr17g0807231 [Helianthus annuus]